ncbi:MAG TPA: CSLREA domain-containing protein [Candidatus Binatia bacterium]|jgi:CSLREA domain-containing protein|nr:CSLREA domain-containing protein [Candidatus Binatia bacterium]
MSARWTIAVLAAWLAAAAPLAAATFTVTSTGDGADASTADGTCADAGGACTLRAAIQQANAAVGSDTIAFAIAGSPVIAPTRSLPPVSGTVTIDGTTQPGGRVTLDGVGAGPNASGLVLQGPGSTVQGLAVGRFAKNGIMIFGANGSSIANTFAGIAADGVAAAPNGVNGILIGGSNVTVTGSAVGFNGEDGVAIAIGGTGNRLTQTRFLSNGVLGIDLGDDGIVNPNDTLDTDTGANDLQNGPYLIKAQGGEEIDISGGLVSTPNTTYTLEFFRSPACSPSESGEGAVFIGSTTVATDSDGGTTFSAVMSVAGTSEWITATATAPNGSTSEFSDCVKVGRPPKVTTSTVATSTSSSTTTTTSSTSTTSSSTTTSSTSTSTTTSTTATTLPGSTSTSSTTTTTSSSTTTTEPAIPTGPLPACVRDPGGLAVDDVGQVYLSDRVQGGITVFDALTGQSTPVVGGLTAPGDIEIRGCDVLVAEANDVVEQRLGVSGRVLDFDFLPAANARVTVRSVKGQSSKTFATDGDGRFAIALDFVPCELQGTVYVTVQSLPTADRPSRTVEVPVFVRPGTPRRPFGHTVAEIVLPAP